MPPGLLEGLFGALFGALSGVVGYKFFNSECRMKYGQHIQRNATDSPVGDELSDVSVGQHTPKGVVVPIHAIHPDGVPCYINGTLFLPKRGVDGTISYVPAPPMEADGR